MWDIAERFEFLHDASHHKTVFEVIRPYWTHRIADRREAKIYERGDPTYGGLSIVEAERMHEALGKAIALAKTLKLEKPQKQTL